MYFDPLKFPLLDGTLIPPPQQTVPYAEDILASGKVDNEATCGEPPADHQQQNEEPIAAEEYDAYSDPSLPFYFPRDSGGAVDFSHHRSKCLVCRHAYRAVIEHDYLTWRDPDAIAQDCGFRDARPILRHAEATGLHRHRARRITSALERLIHKASSATPSAGSIVSAIKLYAQMTGSWAPPPRQVVVTHVRQVARDDARHGAAHSVPDGAYHGERHGVPYEAREDMRPGARDGVQQSVPDDFPHGACGDASNSALADGRPSARNCAGNAAGNAAQQGVPHDRRQSAGDGLRDDVSRDLRQSVGDGVRDDVSHDLRQSVGDDVRGEARHGVDEEVEQGTRREWRDEVLNNDSAAARRDSASGEGAAREAAASPEVPAPTEESTPHPEFQGGSLPSLAPVSRPRISDGPRPSPATIPAEVNPLPAPGARISNQLSPRLESDLSP
jgi:hypothetical protein